MKKFIAVILAITMIFASFGVLSFAEDETEDKKSLLDKALDSLTVEDFESSAFYPGKGDNNGNSYFTQDADVQALLANGMINDASMLGLSVDFLYYQTRQLTWADVSISKDDITIVEANLNTYLKEVMVKRFGSLDSKNLYNKDNAKLITDFIGGLLSPYYVPAVFPTDHLYSTEKDFYSAIVEYSGLKTVIQKNWCDAATFNMFYKPLLAALGFDFNDDEVIGAESKMKDADRVSRVLVKSVITKMLQQGPLNYIFTTIANIANGYDAYMYPAIKGLFYAWIANGSISEDELMTMSGLFNLIVNHNNLEDEENVHFITVPEYRFGSTVGAVSEYSTAGETNMTEMFLYMLLYLNLVGRHNVTVGDKVIHNSNAVEGYKAKILANKSIDGTARSRIATIIDVFFTGSAEGLKNLIIINTEIMAELVNNVMDPHFGRMLITWFTRFMESVANFFIRIYDSLKNFGNF